MIGKNPIKGECIKAVQQSDAHSFFKFNTKWKSEIVRQLGRSAAKTRYSKPRPLKFGRLVPWKPMPDNLKRQKRGAPVPWCFSGIILVEFVDQLNLQGGYQHGPLMRDLAALPLVQPSDHEGKARVLAWTRQCYKQAIACPLHCVLHCVAVLGNSKAHSAPAFRAASELAIHTFRAVRIFADKRGGAGAGHEEMAGGRDHPVACCCGQLLCFAL